MGRDVHVIVVEGKHFTGEQHHNQCSGVLSPPIIDLLEEGLRVPFPHHLKQSTINGYVLHAARRQIVLDGEPEPSVALRRVQFDAYMLDAARERGVEVLSARVTGLELHDDRVLVYTEGGPLEAGVVVGAFGLDEGTAAIFSRAVGYHPPRALSSIITKYHPDEAGMVEFGHRIHAFLPPSPRIEFGAITPKGDHLTVNIGGAAVNADQMEAFLRLPGVRQALPHLENAGRFFTDDLRYFGGRFPCGLARNFAGDRFVMVGDAAGLVRAFKGKGVTSAIQTGIRAAQIILHQGVSATAFQAYYTANRDIIDDLPYGHAMRRLTIMASQLGLMDAVLSAARRDAGLLRALFGAVSGQRPYREVVRMAFTLSSFLAIASAVVRGIVSRTE